MVSPVFGSPRNGDASSTRLSPLLRTIRTISVIGIWYCVSASIIFIQKWLMSGPDSPTPAQTARLFPCPLTITLCSNSVVTVWAFLVSRAPHLRPQPLAPDQFRKFVLPIGMTTALEIGCSNIALLMLTVSFGTILKGGAPVFTLLWCILLRIESFSLPLSVAVTLIAGGITLASVGEGSDFMLLGFILQLSATALGGFRWVLTHVLLKGDSANVMPPLTAVLYTSPTTAACILPFALALESSKVANHLRELDGPGTLRLVGLLLVIATLVFLILMSEYWLLTDTSSLALSVAGVFKECMTIGGGILFFKDRFSLLNTVGFVICQFGICLYVWLRYDPEEPSSKSQGLLDDGSGAEPARGVNPYRLVDDENAVDDPWDSANSPLVPVAAGDDGGGATFRA